MRDSDNHTASLSDKFLRFFFSKFLFYFLFCIKFYKEDGFLMEKIHNSDLVLSFV